jgi:hypothetical protein
MFKLDIGSELDMTEKKVHKQNRVPHVIIRNNTKPWRLKQSNKVVIKCSEV